MCLDYKKPVVIPRVEAWKVFAVLHHGVLVSPFDQYPPRYLPFYPNKLVNCLEGRYFYALADKQIALKLAIDSHGGWNFCRCDYRIVLPVTLVDVCYEGSWHVYFQKAKAYMCKKIIVHDSPEHRKEFLEQINEEIRKVRCNFMKRSPLLLEIDNGFNNLQAIANKVAQSLEKY